MVKDDEYSLDKEKSAFNDLFDAFRLSPKKGIDIYYYFDELNNKLYVNNF